MIRSLVVGLALGLMPAANAAPVRAQGKATASETKEPSLAGARARALRRARRTALETALSQLSVPIDGEARKDVLAAADAWTGAYRILSEHGDGEAVNLEIEVDIDLVRLTKRVAKRDPAASGRPVFRLAEVTATPACGDVEAVRAMVRTELSGQGSVALDGKGPALTVALECQPLGPVQHTYLRAARVRITGSSGGQAVAELSVPAFATTPEEAVTAAIQRALSDASSQLRARRSGHVRVQVRAPLPSERIRRLETAMRNSVLGVDEVEVGALSRGVVELHVRGTLSAKELARKLGELSLPGFSLTIVDVDPPDALTIRLE
ncbi:hypothetical protein [Paraliomyxa miuraensis]|uniref:hypothetical protein n=1 Tax=Paraliomyxa miuraensis TaxID=376150 RepID=UPI002250DAAA|nr:hypothetical protein [Paraliomyxa miuraensis]MCX4245912.1 hypothetical protein [Paraliomyxa miuraensis]